MVTNSLKDGCSTTANGCRPSHMKLMTSMSTVACGTCLFAALNIRSGNLACVFAESLFGVAVVFRCRDVDATVILYCSIFDGCFLSQLFMG